MQIIRINKITPALAFFALMTCFSQNAKAQSLLDFDFYSTEGTTSQSMTGRIFGLSDNSTSTPSSVALFTINGVTVNTIFSAYNTIYRNFTVNDGQITGADFNVTIFGKRKRVNGRWVETAIPGTVYYFENLTLGYAGQNHANFFPVPGDYQNPPLVYVSNAGFSAVTYTQVASVPEPSSLSLLAIGLGGLALVRRRK
jgi:hypothetical protein